MNTLVDQYLIDGCGRCAFYKTPDCKVNTWRDVLVELRRIVLDCGLTEEYKWKQPCYTYDGKNILMVTAFKEFGCVSLFKGVLLQDPDGKLVAPGQNSQAARQLRFTTTKQVVAQESVIRAFARAAIKTEKDGRQVSFSARHNLDYPEELRQRLGQDATLRKAFEALTPGRQRSHILHISSAKQSKTRENRVDKCIPKIMAGRGFNEYR